jgi:hypothetical protein
MRLSAIPVVVSLLATVAAGQLLAAIPAPRSTREARARMVADAKAAEPSPARVIPASPASPEAERLVLLERVLRQRDNLWSARLDDLHARIYEVFGQVQLVAACLIGLLLAMFVWLASITRQVAQLTAERRAERSGGFG